MHVGRAAEDGRSTEAEARAILDEAVHPAERMRLGSGLAAFGLADLLLGVERLPSGRRRDALATRLRGQIAAIAASRNLSVATRDEARFRAAGLTVINPWTAEA